jgi:hypothetical protein
MNPFKEFAAFEGKVYAATTKRVYLSAAKKALKIGDKTPEECGFAAGYPGARQRAPNSRTGPKGFFTT